MQKPVINLYPELHIDQSDCYRNEKPDNQDDYFNSTVV